MIITIAKGYLLYLFSVGRLEKSAFIGPVVRNKKTYHSTVKYCFPIKISLPKLLKVGP